MAAPKQRHSGMFKPGQSGNPAGRPKNKASLTGLTREVLKRPGKDGKTNEELIAEMLVNEALKGESWALREVWDRMEGKAVAKIEQDITTQDLSAKVSFKGKPAPNVEPIHAAQDETKEDTDDSEAG